MGVALEHGYGWSEFTARATRGRRGALDRRLGRAIESESSMGRTTNPATNPTPSDGITQLVRQGCVTVAGRTYSDRALASFEGRRVGLRRVDGNDVVEVLIEGRVVCKVRRLDLPSSAIMLRIVNARRRP